MKKGFTLIELLIVIAILALLMSIIVVTLNPAELLRKSRDTKRVSDLNALRTSLNLYVTDKSAPDLDIYGTCGSNTWLSLTGNGVSGCTALASSYCTTTPRLTTGAGWIPVNFGSISSGSPLSTLPVDPTNATSTTPFSNLYYAYQCNSTNMTFELNAAMESSYYRSSVYGSTAGDGDVCSTDGGNSTLLYEVGSDPGLDLLNSTSTGYFYP
ncbi:MAG TPA: type II secretion system protein [Candidatus Paceibacterota bacterium]|nr:type II secretion system protein [Candidatus Paceibacterota bacterium]HPT40394.1 type II secretion system protein [Candidatus Paceibacterota bacterium]